MHKEVLNKNQAELLPLLELMFDQFGLVGGTAIALHIGHRRSVDFDLFSKEEFDSRKVREKIIEFGKIEQVIRDEKDQYTMVVKGVGLTFLYYPYDIDFTDRLDDIIKLPNLLTLAAMKAHTLGRRAKWKDYVDLYFVMKDHHSFKEVVKKAEEIFGSEFNEKLFRSQLAYFEDIDYTEKVNYLEGFKTTEQEIKEWLKEVSLN